MQKSDIAPMNFSHPEQRSSRTIAMNSENREESAGCDAENLFIYFLFLYEWQNYSSGSLAKLFFFFVSGLFHFDYCVQRRILCSANAAVWHRNPAVAGRK